MFHTALCLLLALFHQAVLADVVVPYPRSVRACITVENGELTAQGRSAAALLLSLPGAGGIAEHIQLSIRNESDAEVTGDWDRLQRAREFAAARRPGVAMDLHLTRYDRGVPFANRERDLCPAGQVQIGLVRTGTAPLIEEQNPCTPGRPSFCNVLCKEGQCGFAVGSPGLPLQRDPPDTGTGGVHACLPTMGKPLDAASLKAAEFVLAVDASQSYPEEAAVSIINWPTWSTIEADWEQAMALARLIRDKRPNVGAISVNVSSGNGGLRFLNTCSIGQSRIQLLRVGRPRVPLPCPTGWIGFCEVRCEEGRCGFHSPPIFPAR